MKWQKYFKIKKPFVMKTNTYLQISLQRLNQSITVLLDIPGRNLSMVFTGTSITKKYMISNSVGSDRWDPEKKLSCLTEHFFLHFEHLKMTPSTLSHFIWEHQTLQFSQNLAFFSKPLSLIHLMHDETVEIIPINWKISIPDNCQMTSQWDIYKLSRSFPGRACAIM